MTPIYSFDISGGVTKNVMRVGSSAYVASLSGYYFTPTDLPGGDDSDKKCPSSCGQEEDADYCSVPDFNIKWKGVSELSSVSEVAINAYSEEMFFVSYNFL